MSTGTAQSVGQEGLANLANSIRRSTALYIAMQVSPEHSTDEELLRRADKFAAWLRGTAGSSVPSDGTGFMGVDPWQTNPL